MPNIVSKGAVAIVKIVLQFLPFGGKQMYHLPAAWYERRHPNVRFMVLF